MPAMEAQYMEGEEAEEHPAHGEMVAHIVEKLRHDILEHKFAPGSRLVENDLTHRFHVSRGPIREALRRLAAEGLIEHLPNRGALVRRLSRKEIRELFEIRIELEALAARLAANADDEAERRKFSAAIAPIYETGARLAPVYLEENAAFHSAIMDLAGNRQLHELALRLQLPLLMAQVGDILSASVLDDSVREHRELATAILTHDANAADAALRAHLGRAAKLALARSMD